MSFVQYALDKLRNAGLAVSETFEDIRDNRIKPGVSLELVDSVHKLREKELEEFLIDYDYSIEYQLKKERIVLDITRYAIYAPRISIARTTEWLGLETSEGNSALVLGKNDVLIRRDMINIKGKGWAGIFAQLAEFEKDDAFCKKVYCTPQQAVDAVLEHFIAF